jgi:para-nitrobenzyl esterase
VTDPVTVRTAAGALRGRALGDITAYLGIPYGAPATGERRWSAPQPASPWPGVRPAVAFGPVAPQPDRAIGHWSHGPTPPAAEDCLSLNVWAPAVPARSPRPVLVWIHGGGWALGFSASPVLDGSRLAAAAGAVVVTLNYRLGSLGWLNHPQLGANWGMRDQALALAWVRDHIEAFGGDPARVTLAGQSAGAGSALHLLSSPLGDGLFSRVIAQSPPLGELTVPAHRGRAWAEAMSRELGGAPDQHTAGAASPGPGTVSDLDLPAMRAAPAAAVVAAHEALLATPEFRGTRGGAMPVPDPATLPADPRAVPAARSEVPVVIGTAADEATFLFRAGGRQLDLSPGRLEAMVAHLPDVGGLDAARAMIAAERAEHAGQDEDGVLCRLATRQLFADPVTDWAQARAAAGGTVFRYRIEHRGPDARLGATHTIDVPLLFATHDTEVGARVAGDGPAAVAASGAMIGAWRAFVHGEAPWDAGTVRTFG